MSQDQKPSKDKDLTGIFELPQAESSPTTDSSSDPFAMNELPQVESIDSFESIDQLGMMDHPTPEEAPSETTNIDLPSNEPTVFSEPSFEPMTEPMVEDPLEDLKQYSEMTRGPIEDLPIHHPFHLFISGSFGPFERDKLLLFITENPIGIASSDLDLQIKAGRVLLPRISEYAGIRLIQELRDSGLQFSLKPSKRDEDEFSEPARALEFHYDGQAVRAASSAPIPILDSTSTALSQYEELDTVQAHQFVKAEMIEVERSDLFQEVVDRMTESLKQKARLKGGHALTRLNQKIAPLRLPSQYQISVSAIVLRSK